MTPPPPDPRWLMAERAILLWQMDPSGLGGLWLRARAGSLRDRLLAGITAFVPRRIAPGIVDEALYGGLDLAATLATGCKVIGGALLASPTPIALTMAERCPPGLAVRLGRWIDEGGALLALDEAADGDDSPPSALTDRLGLFVDLDGIGWQTSRAILPDAAALDSARARLRAVHIPAEAVEAITATAARMGIASLRAPLLALACARASAALRGADTVEEEDLRLAAALCLAPRALTLPDAPEDDAEPPPPEPSNPEEGEDATAPDPETMQIPEEMLLEAVRAALPPGLLEKLAAGRAARVAAGSGGTGAGHKGNRRGRPLPSRAGRPDGKSRIDPVATLRAAAPWQPIRRRLSPDRTGLLIRAEDFRLRRFQEMSDRVLIFAVDASGSAAMARLGEAKGAVELLLAQAYSRRDHVALLAFRGTGAELLLPPTRSLVQTKRRLAGLPGGGGTPLASGLRLGMELAQLARRRGMTPTLALLTDGRANVTLDGRGDRATAMEEATRMARAFAASGTPGLVLDTANRPQPELRALAAAMRAPYLPLPRADARALSAVLSSALEG
ncbi:MAG: magnesium chelatase subunit D [Pseudorhodobacter sp.]